MTWARHKRYSNLADFQTDLGIDTAGVVLDPGFANLVAGHYGLRAERMAQLKQCYPQGPVPGVTLGLQP